MLVLCLARPEFLESRPDWAGESVALEALSPEESVELLVLLARRAERADRDQIVATASGNPLFLEQLAAFAAERESPERGRCASSTLQSLLAARLDGLGPGERAVLERAAVVGREFWAGAVADLLPPRGRATLTAASRRRSPARGSPRLVARRRPSSKPSDSGTSSSRRPAYRSLPKGRRAEFHESVAAWLERSPSGLSVDKDQVIGYHLEQAHRYRSELGPADGGLRSLGERAGGSARSGGPTRIGSRRRPRCCEPPRARPRPPRRPASKPRPGGEARRGTRPLRRARTAVLASGKGPSTRQGSRATVESNGWPRYNAPTSASGLTHSGGPASESQRPPLALSRSFRR